MRAGADLQGRRMSSILYFVRHGQTDWNAEGRFQGQQDVPLNALGRRQALRNGVALAAMLKDADAADFVASPLGRARETMEILRGAMGLDPSGYRLDDRLKEITFGAWEGRTLRELAAAEPDVHAAREADRWGFTPPAGESYRALAERVAPVLADLGPATVMVAHGGIMRVLRGLLCGVADPEVPHLPSPQDRIMRVADGRVDWH